MTGLYKVDLRYGATDQSGKVTQPTRTPYADVAMAAYRKLLGLDLTGDIAARFVVEGAGGKSASLYYSKFDRPFGQGRIHPDAYLDPYATREHADKLASWRPGDPENLAARLGLAGGELGERAAAATSAPASPSMDDVVGILRGWLRPMVGRHSEEADQVLAGAREDLVNRLTAAAAAGESQPVATIEAFKLLEQLLGSTVS